MNNWKSYSKGSTIFIIAVPPWNKSEFNSELLTPYNQYKKMLY